MDVIGIYANVKVRLLSPAHKNKKAWKISDEQKLHAAIDIESNLIKHLNG